ncbi:hypothetical protein O7635_24115 [Asanoa sp. WMMD1127]|uniref:hypothetical protein n=1 Tax=Asanoa sp. WMMD1127 TaxID=3016107 RepID=UPI002415E763|nr:hypothetical protein [Asanoa sp. WMMD1127]MDG4824946.1 hypothetical protein [Asanoa sp. WMMD1127]
MSTDEKHPYSIIPATLGGCVAVALTALAVRVAVPGTAERVVIVAVAVGVLSALLRDTRPWLAVVAVGAVAVVVLAGAAYLFTIGVAAFLGRGQRWIRSPRTLALDWHTPPDARRR